MSRAGACLYQNPYPAFELLSVNNIKNNIKKLLIVTINVFNSCIQCCGSETIYSEFGSGLNKLSYPNPVPASENFRIQIRIWPYLAEFSNVKFFTKS
jgi:hypothetical protein